MKITDLKCAVIGDNPVVRIVTDEGISGYGEIESYKPYPKPAVGKPDWWYDIVEGLPDPIVNESFIDVWDRPGMGVEFNIEAAHVYLSEEDRDFFA